MEEAILAYLREHPRAMDTLEGIAEWWLMHHRIRRDAAILQTILERLIREGVLEEIPTSESSMYRLRIHGDTTTRL